MLEQQVQALQPTASAPVSNYAAPSSAPLPPPTNYYPSPPADYYAPPLAYAPPMYGYGDPYYPYAYPSYAYPSVVVAPRRFVRPVHRFGGHRFGVGVLPKPVMPVTHVAHRR